MADAWEVLWDRFFLEDVQTFGDYLSSYEPGRELVHLPTAEEVERQYPNPCGYGTGMEDGAILGGAMLSLIIDRHAVTGEERMREDLAKVFGGLKRCATAHGVPGFLARNVCPTDEKLVYINSSRDQVTHCVHGLWKYYHSGLADEMIREEIRIVLASIADRMTAFCTPENHYDFCRADGVPGPLGICRMWEVQAHEAARLPMIYAAAWDVTGNQAYHKRYRELVAKAVSQSVAPDEHLPAYALLQMQCSLELLRVLETDENLRSEMDGIMRHVAGIATKRATQVSRRLSEKTPQELAMLGPDWRTVPEWKDQCGYRIPQWGAYREIWHLIREAGEANLVPLMVTKAEITVEQERELEELVRTTDYRHCSSCGIVFHLAAYWKARRLEQ
ncbi:MAG: hypothetical protein KDN19_03710 [Verrucomicrobiae bacterium]|nr:hypothetical protein [Verrucomicrobiae bacterium]